MTDDLTIDQKRALMQIKIKDMIEKCGCFCMGVFGDKDTPSWTYSIGIPTTVPGAAEIIVYGFDPNNASQAINIILDQMRNGRVFESGRAYDDILQGNLSVFFGRVEERHYYAHFGQAINYHGGIGFEVWQLVWPDESGKFPWQTGFDEKLREAQPLLFEPEE